MPFHRYVPLFGQNHIIGIELKHTWHRDRRDIVLKLRIFLIAYNMLAPEISIFAGLLCLDGIFILVGQMAAGNGDQYIFFHDNPRFCIWVTPIVREDTWNVQCSPEGDVRSGDGAVAS